MPTREEEIRNAALDELDKSSTGSISTSELIEILTLRFGPSGKDAQIADNRNDTNFSQKVRNLVSHKDENTGLQSRGLADYDENAEGWTITNAGRVYVKNLG